MKLMKGITSSNYKMLSKTSISDGLFLNRMVCYSFNGTRMDQVENKRFSVSSKVQPNLWTHSSICNVPIKNQWKLSPIMWHSNSPFATFTETDLENRSSLIPHEKLDSANVLDIESLSREVKLDEKKHKVGALDSVSNYEFIDSIAPFIGPTFNLAVHVNKSSTLQELVKLGVNLHELEYDSYKARFVLSLKFEEDVKPFLLFLHSLQVPPEEWGRILTINPFLLKEDQDVLLSRVEYLKSKKFSTEAIANIISTYPDWLSKSIVTVDCRLGFLQKQFALDGDGVRAVATARPRLVFYEQMKILEIHFILCEEFGFTKEQIRDIVVYSPSFFLKTSDGVRTKLLLITKKMALSHEAVMQFPGVLVAKTFILENRHYFLKTLGRAQYDPTKANFVSPDTFARVSDAEFAVEVARSSVCAYHAFLKML